MTSKIEWTEETWNPVTGCTKVSQGCKNCYAERQWPRMVRLVPSYAGRDFTDVRTHADRLDNPLHWKRPRRIFVNSMSDLFHDDVPDEFIDQVFAVMALAPQHTFQVLTKRPARMLEYLSRPAVEVRVGLQAMAMCFDAAVKTNGHSSIGQGVSLAEPLLGVVDVRWALSHQLDIAAGFLARGHFSPGLETLRPLDWAVVGGESGPKARPMHTDWARSLRDQCAAAGVPFLFKQWGEWIDADAPGVDMLGTEHSPMFRWLDGTYSIRLGKRLTGRLLDGVQHDGYPEVKP
jgi:protein gp37